MARTNIPDAELAVLKVLWDREAATVREIAEDLYPAGGASEHATVQKLLERLEARACVARRRDGRANVWFPSVGRGEVVRDRLREAADKLTEGALAPLLTELVHGGNLNDHEIAELRRAIDDADRGSAPAGG